jgi:hypothetical protein
VNFRPGINTWLIFPLAISWYLVQPEDKIYQNPNLALNYVWLADKQKPVRILRADCTKTIPN